MARRSSAVLLAAALAAMALLQLAGLAVTFVAPPRAPLQVQGVSGAAGLAGVVAVAPQPAQALAELTYDGWGPAEITAVIVPIVFVIGLFLEWESKQPDEDDIGVGYLGRTVDGPEGTYCRRSPETG
mmetsp:Transcript_5171/g.12842  ORF Transcript_5171/g.12842 Transcript_5171/m.12842 type:complete len:127 (-) Transcript_5171:116-496(-)